MRPAVLVTGAARRLGRHIALHLAQHGWDVAVHHRHAPDPEAEATAADLRALGARVLVLAAELGDEAAVEGLVPAAVAAFGRLDAVVNNASRFEHDTIATLSHASLDAHWRTNTAAGLILARALHRHCAEAQRQGCVVNLLDQKLWAPNPDHLSYTLSKAALAAATPILAQALAPWVRVVGVAPGLTLGSPDIDAARLAKLQSQTPLGLGVAPDDIARTVHYLLSTPSVTGTSIVVDAGSHLTRMTRDFAFTDTDSP